MRLVKQFAGALLALSLAVIRPAPSEFGLAVPHAPPSWHTALNQALHAWTSKVEVEPAEPFESDQGAAPACECLCNVTERLQVPEAALFVAVGFSLWPFLDLLHLLKKAWQKQVAAAERRLQLRPPDRPWSRDASFWLAHRTRPCRSHSRPCFSAARLAATSLRCPKRPQRSGLARSMWMCRTLSEPSRSLC